MGFQAIKSHSLPSMRKGKTYVLLLERKRESRELITFSPKEILCQRDIFWGEIFCSPSACLRSKQKRGTKKIGKMLFYLRLLFHILFKYMSNSDNSAGLLLFILHFGIVIYHFTGQ